MSCVTTTEAKQKQMYNVLGTLNTCCIDDVVSLQERYNIVTDQASNNQK